MNDLQKCKFFNSMVFWQVDSQATFFNRAMLVL